MKESTKEYLLAGASAVACAAKMWGLPLITGKATPSWKGAMSAQSMQEHWRKAQSCRSAEKSLEQKKKSHDQLGK